ncbi:dihydropteroate synthase [Ruminiclostridium cellulolyticum]|uniref:Dihydropteroate synthase n=1 Tax=Ruminiclostridium cellulolyticum (strain ATCC 35319 / DSM 5812 / JCM 6584 / H10) TaxID=394503 RepID=B8I186_RUMCH|nr:dihydropteroate synthase [Ruminiclostridium cellulolyticum]ACL75684.1 dihydropteroate synthase [Ruminiclostridium cellulolyticum H10]
MKVEFLKIGNSIWKWGKKTYVMGILNITPDSFSDGGSYTNPEIALNQALRMIEEGADIIDVGGETTKPGAVPVSSEIEQQRIIPVIEALSKEIALPVSVDTYRADTAELAIQAGAAMINDIWGLKYDSRMASIIAEYNVSVCIMHNRTTGTDYGKDLIGTILKELEGSILIAKNAGIGDDKIIIDPGIGFAKTWEQNLEVMHSLEDFKRLGYPVLLGTSRKSFIGKVLGLEVPDRLEGTLATTAAGISKGVDIVRVHDVLQNVRVAKMTDSMVR